MVEMEPAKAKELFDGCVKAAYVLEMDGMWMLTESGEEAVSQFRNKEMEGQEEGIKAVYEKFDEENKTFKKIVSEWQKDKDDQNAIKELEGVHTRIGEIFEELTKLVPRYGIYPARFSRALQKLKGGEIAYLAKYSVDSYHTIWFELHEDLLNLLGLERDEEE